MNNGAVIVFVVSVILIGLLGIYAGFHVKKQDDEELKKKSNWADSEVELISDKSTKV